MIPLGLQGAPPEQIRTPGACAPGAPAETSAGNSQMRPEPLKALGTAGLEGHLSACFLDFLQHGF